MFATIGLTLNWIIIGIVVIVVLAVFIKLLTAKRLNR